MQNLFVRDLSFSLQRRIKRNIWTSEGNVQCCVGIHGVTKSQNLRLCNWK